MKKVNFRLNAVTLSVLLGFSTTAISDTSNAIKNVDKLKVDETGQYVGGGAVFIGGADGELTKEGWLEINPNTAGYDKLKERIEKDINDPDNPLKIDTDLVKSLHGQRLMTKEGDNFKPGVAQGGEFGLDDAKIYSKVESYKFSSQGDSKTSVIEDVGAVISSGDLYETASGDHQRDVLKITNSVIDNTLTDNKPFSKTIDGETFNSDSPHAVGLIINHDSVNGGTTDINGKTNKVPKKPNIEISNVKVTAQNLGLMREDNHVENPQNGAEHAGGKYLDKDSTAVKMKGSGLHTTITDSVLTGGVNGAGNSLLLSGRANLIDIKTSVLNGNIDIKLFGETPKIIINVKKIDNNDPNKGYELAGSPDDSALLLDSSGNSFNITDSIINGDITNQGQIKYDIIMRDVTDKENPTDINQDADKTLVKISKDVRDKIDQTALNNVDNKWNRTSVRLNHSVLNGGVGGTAQLLNSKNDVVLDRYPDMDVTNGSVWNAAGRENSAKTKISDVHDLNLSASTLNLVHINTDKPTLGIRDQYKSDHLEHTRVIVHNNLLQDKDENDNYKTSVINVGKSLPDPLEDIAGQYSFGSLQVKGSVQGNYWLNIDSSGIEPYVKNGYLSNDNNVTHNDKGYSFVNYKDAGNESEPHFAGTTELGVYQYVVVDEKDDNAGERNVYFKNSGRLSNAAALASSMPAAQANVATMESDALTRHLTASRHANDDGGVWVAYYGGENENSLDVGPTYNVKTNGVMLGVDSRFDAAKGGSWLAGVAVNSGSSHLSVMNSKGNLDSYGAQFYLSRRFDNGLFVDTQAQFDHFSNKANVIMLNGNRSHGEYSSNGYGLGMKVGYTWENAGYYVEPYLKASGHIFDGRDFGTLDNGMLIRSDDFKSMMGEIGVDLGYTFEISQGYVKPYLHLAGTNEFADKNKIRINNVSLNNSIDGAAFRVGAGAEVQLYKNFGGYAAFDYTKGNDIKSPWQATVGISYSW